MRIFKNIADIVGFIRLVKENGLSVGFVPTMGALHAGHFSLMEISKRQNDISVVSIFLNPIQFNNNEDLKNYPKDIDKDLGGLVQLGIDAAFIPDEKEIYPEPDHSIFDFGLLDKVMEGKHREGHFRGVAIVVKKLFGIVNPDRAYFGEKDFQQLAIIKELVKQLNLPVKIVACPIVRENDGLAMSSRNQLLTVEQRREAAKVSEILFFSRAKAGKESVEELKLWVVSRINEVPLLSVEYFEIVDDSTLQSIDNWDVHQGIHGCIAVNVGKVRLIDNIKYNL